MKKRILCMFCAVLMLCALALSAYALEVPDLERKGSISMVMTYREALVPGGSLTLYRVADVHVDGGDYSFRYTADYSGCDVSLADLSSQKTAQALADYTAQKQLEGTTRQISDIGVIAFEDLELGLYLLVQNESAEGYSPVAPFLVSVPGRDEAGSFVYDVDGAPKLELIPEETEPTEPEETEPTKPTEPTLPQTGQSNWPVPFLAAFGSLLVLLGCYLNTADRKRSAD